MSLIKSRVLQNECLFKIKADCSQSWNPPVIKQTVLNMNNACVLVHPKTFCGDFFLSCTASKNHKKAKPDPFSCFPNYSFLDCSTKGSGKTKCPKPFFACLSGRCIPKSWTCDKEKDCENGADEAHCGMSARKEPRRGSGAAQKHFPFLI